MRCLLNLTLAWFRLIKYEFPLVADFYTRKITAGIKYLTRLWSHETHKTLYLKIEIKVWGMVVVGPTRAEQNMEENIFFLFVIKIAFHKIPLRPEFKIDSKFSFWGIISIEIETTYFINIYKQQYRNLLHLFIKVKRFTIRKDKRERER